MRISYDDIFLFEDEGYFVSWLVGQKGFDAFLDFDLPLAADASFIEYSFFGRGGKAGYVDVFEEFVGCLWGYPLFAKFEEDVCYPTEDLTVCSQLVPCEGLYVVSEAVLNEFEFYLSGMAVFENY